MLKASICMHMPLEIISASRDNAGAVTLRTVGSDDYGDLTIFAGDRFDALMAAFPLAKDFKDYSNGGIVMAPDKAAAE